MDKKRIKLIDEFIKWNSKINLSAIREKDDIYIKHILDSIELNKIFKFENKSTCVDFGTGGGFPMLPLAICNPNIDFIGIESKNKKVKAVNDMINTLKIKNSKAIWIRLEDYKEKHDYIIARAVGHIKDIFNISQQKIKKGGTLIFYKQLNYEEDSFVREICDSKIYNLINRHLYKLKNDDIKRIIYVIKKI